MAVTYDKDTMCTSVVSPSNLVGAEGYIVDYSGNKTANNTQAVKGVVKFGRPANIASEVIYKGECMAYVTIGANSSVAVGTRLSASANGCWEVAGGTTLVGAVCLEANNTANNTHLLRVCKL
jgi:hypothetical protein